MYADDVKIFRPVNTHSDHNELQRVIKMFSDWCNRNFLVLCIDKCAIISFTRARQPIYYNYDIDGQTINRVDTIRDLGILLDHKLTFTKHIEDVVSRANRTLGLVRKMTKEFNDPLCIKTLFNSLVRSILEYGSIVWCPHTDRWIKRIESVQRKMTRFAIKKLRWPNGDTLPYRTRCLLLGEESLEKRREKAKTIFMAKLIKGEIDAPRLLSKVNIHVPRSSPRSSSLLYVDRHNTNYAANEPISAMARSFNSFYAGVDFHTSMSTISEGLRYINL